MPLRRDAEGHGIGAEDRRSPTGWGNEWNEVGAGEADEAGLSREPDVGAGDDQLPVTNRSDSYAVPLAGALDTRAHRAYRRAGPTSAVSVEEEGTVALAEDAHLRPGIQRAVAIEVGEEAERRDAVVRMATELGVDQEPSQSLSVFCGEFEPLERGSEAAAQLVDPHESCT